MVGGAWGRGRDCGAATVAVLLAVAAGGCFDGTVRSVGGGRMHHQVRPEGGGRGRTHSGISIAAVGDTAMGVTPALPPDPASYFAPVEAELKGDVVFGNLEGTLTDVSESPKCGPESSE